MSDDESSAGQGTARDSVLAGASRDHRRQLRGRGLCADTGSGGRKARSSPAARFGRRLISEYPDWGTFVPLLGNAGLNTQVRGALTRLGLLAYERNFNGMTSRRAQPIPRKRRRLQRTKDVRYWASTRRTATSALTPEIATISRISDAIS
jgi:hypothetical protein